MSKFDESWQYWHNAIARTPHVSLRIGVLQRAEYRSRLASTREVFDAILDQSLKPCPLLYTVAGEPQAHQREDRRQNTGERAGRILLVEDSAANQLVAKTILEHTGYEVDAVENGREALQAFAEESYELVLMDLQMPVMDGYAANAAIREISDEPTPIIALSANVLAEREAESKGIDFEDYIAKPFDRDELIETVGRWVRPPPSPPVVVALPRTKT